MTIENCQGFYVKKKKKVTNLKKTHALSWQLGGLQTHLALDVHGVQLSVVVLGDDLHYILLLKSIFIHPLHGAHTRNRN